MNQISGFANNIVSGIKGLFGIASPSKVMRDEVGKYLAEGVAVGWDKNDPMASIERDLNVGVSRLSVAGAGARRALAARRTTRR